MLTPESLTEILQHNGYLTTQRATRIQAAPVNATTQRFNVSYEGDVPANLRQLLVTSTPLTEAEAHFYGTIQPAMREHLALDELPFIVCLENTPEQIIWEDLSKDYFTFEQRAPMAVHYELVMEGLAQLHAFWWRHSTLPQFPQPENTKNVLASNIHAFLRWIGKDITPQHQQWFEHLATNPFPSTAITLTHHDLHPNNIHHPHDLDGYTKFANWQVWQAGNPTDDLAQLMAVYWLPELRQETEKDFLKTYLEILGEFGVQGYVWADLWEDYRRSVGCAIQTLLLHFEPNPAWWHHCQNALVAFEDLNGADLLGK